MKGDMTKGPIFSKIIWFAIPIILANLFTQFYNAADSLIVGRLVGSDALAAVGACFSVQMIYSAIMTGVGMGATVLCAQYFGAKEYEKVRKAISTAWVIAFVVGVALVVIGMIIAKPVLILLNTPEDILGDATLYLVIVSAGNLTHLFYQMGAGNMRGLGDSKTPLYLLIFCSIFNILLDLLFVAVFHMGVAGVAIATVLAQAVSAILVVFKISRFSQDVYVKKSTFEYVKEDAKKLIQIGYPVAIQNFIFAFGTVMLQIFINHFGTDMVAAGSLIIKVDGFIILPLMAFNQTVLTFTGQNIGAKQPERVKKGIKIVMAMAVVIALVLGIVLWFFGDVCVGVFTTNETVIAAGASGLKVLAFFYWATGLQQCFIGGIGGIGKTKILMLVSIFQLIARIPTSYFMGVHAEKFNGIYYGHIVANMMGFIIYGLYFAKLLRDYSREE